MKQKLKVVGIGEVLWDLPPEGKVLGGAPANFAYHASQLGAEGYVISAIGLDTLGDEIVNQLSSRGLKLRLERVDYPTSTVPVELDNNGVPKFEIIKNVAWDYMTLTNDNMILAEHTDAVCFGSLAQRSEIAKHTILEFIKCVPKK